MSDRYGSNEPSTRGKVLLHTSVGDIDVELWPDEAPMACRNFVQLCLEGYYDRCLFHRIIKGFMAQTGDPTGSGRGGASVYGAPFKDELHSRLRFNHPGVVAMANEEGRRNSCGSQFFLTLGPCEWLNKQHTIFGKVTGLTIYNLLKLNETPVGEGDRPLGDLDDPPRILGVEVISNPFSDIVPRVRASASSSAVAKQPEDSLTSKLAARGQLNKRDTRLVSFGLEEEEEQEERQPVMVLPKESRERHMRTAARDAKAASPSGKRARAASGDEHGERREAKAPRALSGDENGERGEAGAGSPSSYDNKSKKDRKDKKIKKEMKSKDKSGRESDSRGHAEDQDDYRAMREKLRQQHQEQRRRQASAEATAAQPPAAPLSLLEQRRQKYLAKGGERSRQQDTLHMVEAFNEKLRAANRKSQSGDLAGAQQARPALADDARDYKGGIGENRMEDEGFRAVPSRDWMRTELKFRSHIDDAFRAGGKDEQDLTIIDAATASGKRSIEELQKERSR
jgi:peptidyl-prolyl cis-trans isomerase SDCCAG10